MDTLQRSFGPSFRGLWRSPEFLKLWTSLTITSFGAQITNLALPLTAALLLQATPWQMGVLVALETLPFALVILHAGVLIDRVRKLPIVIASTSGAASRCSRSRSPRSSARCRSRSCSSSASSAACRTWSAAPPTRCCSRSWPGASRLVEANAKVALGETSAALVGPGLAGGADPAR